MRNPWEKLDIPIEILPTEALLCPGTPDAFFCDGRRIGWAFLDRGVVWVWSGDAVRILAFPEAIDDVQVGPARWVVSLEAGAWVGDPETGHGVFLDEASRVGADWALVEGDAGFHVLATPGSAAPVKLPQGALRSIALAPWSVGPGVIWIDDDVIYRASATIRPATIGQTGRVDALLMGPLGAVLVQTPEGVSVAAAAGRIVEMVEPADLASVQFSPDGLRILAVLPSGPAEVDLRTGKVLRRWEGPLLPAGYAPDAVFFHEDDGTLVDASGKVLLAGFLFAGPSCGGGRLVGPGGAAWDLVTGERTSPFGCFNGGITAILPEGVLHVADDGGRVVWDEGAEATWPDPLHPDAAARAALVAVKDEDDEEMDVIDEVVVQGDDVVAVSLEGVLLRVDPKTGEVRERRTIQPPPEGRILVTGPGGMVLRDGDGATILASGREIPAVEDVFAVIAGERAFYRAAGDRLEALPLVEGGPAWHTDGVDVTALALGRHLYAIDAGDLLVLDPVTGDPLTRVVLDLEGGLVIHPMPDGTVAVTSDGDGVVLVEPRRGKVLRRLNVPADGVYVDAERRVWMWTEEGSLVRV